MEIAQLMHWLFSWSACHCCQYLPSRVHRSRLSFKCTDSPGLNVCGVLGSVVAQAAGSLHCGGLLQDLCISQLSARTSPASCHSRHSKAHCRRSNIACSAMLCF